MIRYFAYLWASPATCIGLLFVVPTLLSGGRCRIISGVIEVHGGLTAHWLAGGCTSSRSWSAMTLGHVVLGRDERCLASSRVHERVHVRQYERWGVLFFPAYLLLSLCAWLRGGDMYFDNAFEREAFNAGREPLGKSRHDTHLR